MSSDPAQQISSLSTDVVRGRSRDVTLGLRAPLSATELRSGTSLAPGFSIFWDDTQDGVRVRAGSKDGEMRHVEIDVSGDAEWLSLVLWLGNGEVVGGSALVAIFDLETDSDLRIDPFLRTGEHSPQSDTPLQDKVIAGPGGAVSTLIHIADPFEPICRSDAGQSLVLPLPTRSLSLGIRGLSLHLLTPGNGPARPLDRLSAVLGQKGG